MNATVSRTAARKVTCPSCEAPSGERCRGARGKLREANHRERIEAAEKAAARAVTIAVGGDPDRDWNAGVEGAV
jgi:hypothetical protein